MPASIIEPAVGASVCASGSQVCSGQIGTLIAKATTKAMKATMRIVVAGRPAIVPDQVGQLAIAFSMPNEPRVRPMIWMPSSRPSEPAMV